MAEGLLSGILGEDNEKPEVEAPETPASADAFAAAIAHHASTQNPEVAHHASAFLRGQLHHVEVQTKHLEDEHAARLHYLQGQAREVDIRRFGLRLRVGFQIFVALLATAIGAGLIVMVEDAVSSRSVVIGSFDIAPNLSAQVPSGKIVAAGLLDVLTRIQDANHTSVIARNLSNAWTTEIAIEIPETGVSIGKIEGMLKSRFGHDQHIEGDLVQTEKGGLVLTVRGTGILPKTFTDEGRNLQKLTTEAGEYVYGQSQPGLWAAYLSNHNRTEEAIRFAQSSYTGVQTSEKPYLLNAWANALSNQGGEGANVEALPMYREAVRLKPDYWTGYNNIMAALAGLGDEEGEVRVGEQMMKIAGGRPGRAPENNYQNYDQQIWDLQAFRASNIADMESHGGIGTMTAAVGTENLGVAQAEIEMHDGEAAALRLKTTPVDAKNVPDVTLAAMDRGLLAEETGDLKTAAKEWDAFAVGYADPTVATNDPRLICYSAVTYEKTGQPAKADAALKPFGNFTFVDCYRFKGDVLDLRGDWSGAQEWYAKAVKLGPSIPSGYYSWGMALAKHGDLDGAAQKLKEANQKGPHWADPLKAWGDVLVRQGNTKEALAKYDEALKYAPNWKELKNVREALVKHAG